MNHDRIRTDGRHRPAVSCRPSPDAKTRVLVDFGLPHRGSPEPEDFVRFFEMLPTAVRIPAPSPFFENEMPGTIRLVWKPHIRRHPPHVAGTARAAMA